MPESNLPRMKILLVAGDSLVLGLVTTYGFASHDMLGTAGWRMFSTFGPLLLSWFLISPHLLVFDLDRTAQPGQLWRPFWAMVLAGPLAAFLRGMLLNAPIIPLFVIVLGGTAAIALLIWRTLFLIFLRRKFIHNG